MKKFLLGVMALNAICLGANAEKVTYMYVKTNDGNVERYDVRDIYNVVYEKQDSDTVNSEACLIISSSPYQREAYIKNSIEVYYRESDTDLDTATVSGKIGNYDYVDLGLPSGLKWATFNVGANKPTGYGDHFRWGDTVPLDSADYCRWLNTRDEYFNHLNWLEIGPKDSANYYKWRNNFDDKYSVVFDRYVTLEPSDDAATANWGSDWRMPRVDEQQELIDGCFWKWTDNYFGSGVSGCIGTSKTNGNTIFLPDKEGIWPCEKNKGSSVRFLNNSGPNLSWEESAAVGHTIRAVSGENTSIYPVIYFNKTNSTSTTVSGMVSNKAYVDLGLTSGTKWATCNVGASNPTESGDFFAWGETTPKENYAWSTYKWCNDNSLTKYNRADSLTTLLEEDDAATANWGSSWRMPTKAEQDELRDGCGWAWTENFNGSGVEGMIGVSKNNGNTIFFPAFEFFDGTEHVDGYYHGYRFWSSSLYKDDMVDAYDLYIQSRESYPQYSYTARYFGLSVRAVVK